MLYINGRFLEGDRTAVNSVALSLSQALIRAPGDWSVRMAVPPSLEEKATGMNLPHEVVGRKSGILWEQMEYPRLRRRGVLAGFFNTVPLIGSGYVTMLHDAHVFTTPSSYGTPTRIWRQILSRRAGQGGNRILTISDYSKRALLAQGIGREDHIGVVYNGITMSGNEDPGIFDKLPVTSGGGYFVAIASLLPHKNIGVLLRAFADPALSDVGLVLVGKAGKEAYVAAGHEVPGNVSFPGFVSDEELAALYGGAAGVCVPSTEEGFGLPALEGMTYGAPPVISPCASLPEVVGDTGLTAASDDPAAWTAACLQLLDGTSGLRDDLSRRARDRAATFTWDNAAVSALGHLDRWFA